MMVKARSSGELSRIVVSVLLVVLILLLSYVAFGFLPDRRLVIAGQNLDVVVASSTSARTKGLSGRDYLAPSHGMLFSYSVEGEYCMWMKDMNFDIDIVWLDSKKQVIDLVHNVPVESYPDEIFCPRSPARYVLEVNAGSAKEWGVEIGQQAHF